MFLALIGALFISASVLVLGNPNRMSQLCEFFFVGEGALAMI